MLENINSLYAEAYKSTMNAVKKRAKEVAEQKTETKEQKNTAEGGGDFSLKNAHMVSEQITQQNIDTLRSIGRKSVTAFTSEDIKKAEPFARRMFEDLRVKSPFFRAWFGDWRANDTVSRVKVITVSNIESFNAVTDTLRGDFSNLDTGWNNITVGRKGIDDTISHSGKEKASEKTLSEVKNIIQNSILLDTQVSMPDSGKKSKYTVFMHKMYSPVIVNGRNYIAKVAVEEYVENTDTKKKFYNLQNIKISPEAVNSLPYLIRKRQNPILAEFDVIGSLYSSNTKNRHT